MAALPAQFPEIMLLIALLLSVAVRHVIQLVLTALAVGVVAMVVIGMAGYGAFTLLTG